MQDACQIALSKVNYLINRLSSTDYDVVSKQQQPTPRVRVLQLMRNVRGSNDDSPVPSFRELGLGGYPYMPMRSAWRLFNRTFHAGSRSRGEEHAGRAPLPLAAILGFDTPSPANTV